MTEPNQQTNELSPLPPSQQPAKPTTPPIKTESPQKVFEKKKAIFRVYQIIWYILGVIEIILGFRIALKAVGANPFSPFANLVYSISNPLALPFNGILKTSISGTSIFEWSTIVAAVVYALLAYGLIYFLQIVKPVSPDEVEQKVDKE